MSVIDLSSIPITVFGFWYTEYILRVRYIFGILHSKNIYLFIYTVFGVPLQRFQ